MWTWTSKLLVIGSACLLVGCGNRLVDADAANCGYPDSPRTPAPNFICQPNITGFPLTVLRSSENSDREIRERIQDTLDDQILLWASDWSNDWYEDSTQRSRAKQWLLFYLKEEARVVRSRTSPKNVLWLLVGLPNTQDEIKTKLESDIAF